mgnify:CR=1 FL=1
MSNELDNNNDYDMDNNYERMMMMNERWQQ